MKFKLEEYDPVDSRIKKFYSDHEDGGILTDVISDPNNTNYVVVRASVLIGDRIRATGLAQEFRDTELSRTRSGQTYESVNYTSWVENAETSAIGRALANFGYSGAKRPSREEMEKAERNTPEPGETRAVEPGSGHTEDFVDDLFDDIPKDKFKSLFLDAVKLANKMQGTRKVEFMKAVREVADGDVVAMEKLIEEAL